MHKLSALLDSCMETDFMDPSEPTTSDLLERASSQVIVYFDRFCCLFAVAMSFILGFEYDKFYSKSRIKLHEKDVLRLVVLLVFFMTLPVLLMLTLLSLIYKYVCSIIIRSRDNRFVKFLDSFDVFWCLEDNVNNNIIEVLGIIQADSPYSLVNEIKEKLEGVTKMESIEKIFYTRKEQLGFYYWHKNEHINIHQYVKLLNVTNENGLNSTDLENIMTELSNKPLPYNSEGLFEILVTDIELSDEGDFLNNYAIVFRIHHSVGDGIALIEFLCKILADENEEGIQLFKAPEVCNVLERALVKDFVEFSKILTDMILCAVDAIIRRPDINSLHGPALEGKKCFKWIETNDNFIQMIKDIKEKDSSLNFSDILATALSNGLRNYFSRTMLYVPDRVAVIIPVRLSVKEETILLENNFTVSILDLPLKEDMNAISSYCNKMRNNLDPLTNHCLLKLCNVFPKQMLEQVFNSNQATMVFSNIPGPKSLSICGCAIKSLVFFVPNKGSTGVGVTALCYGDVLRFAVMADSALLSNADDLSIILQGMVEEVKRLYEERSAV